MKPTATGTVMNRLLFSGQLHDSITHKKLLIMYSARFGVKRVQGPAGWTRFYNEF